MRKNTQPNEKFFSFSISDHLEEEKIYCCIIHHPLRSAWVTPTSYPVDYAHVVYNGILENPCQCEEYTLFIKVNTTVQEEQGYITIQTGLDRLTKYSLPLYDAMESWDFIFSKAPIVPEKYLGKYEHRYDNVYASKSDLLEEKRKYDMNPAYKEYWEVRTNVKKQKTDRLQRVMWIIFVIAFVIFFTIILADISVPDWLFFLLAGILVVTGYTAGFCLFRTHKNKSPGKTSAVKEKQQKKKTSNEISDRHENSRTGSSLSMDCSFVQIQNWDYLLTFDSMRKVIEVVHHVTPEDGGYGTEVNFELAYDYFGIHSVFAFYEMVCQKHISPSEEYYDMETELRNLTEALKSRGVLK